LNRSRGQFDSGEYERQLKHGGDVGRGDPHYVEVEDRDVPALVAEFEAIGDDVEKFSAFLSRVA
jgi:hypothetical protein